MGEENPLLGAIPPHVMLHLFLYQLRAFALAGFQGVIAVSGHAGGSQNDLRLVANAFTEKTGLLMATLSALPYTLFTLPAGAIGDMIDRKKN